MLWTSSRKPEIRDAGWAASALGRPAQIVFGADAYPTLFDKTAALMQSICLNHALLDGNKRTAVVARHPPNQLEWLRSAGRSDGPGRRHAERRRASLG